MKLVALFLVVAAAGCVQAPTAPSIDAVAFRDPMCRDSASEDCIVLVEADRMSALPTEPFELIVHSDGDLAGVALSSNGTPVDVVETGRELTASGTDVTLLVSPLPFGQVEATSGGAAFRFTAIDPKHTLSYGSTYSSNCYCLSCTTYCAVNGKTEKAGTCCT